MKKEILHKTDKQEVVAVYHPDGSLICTRTTIFDSEGYAERTIRVFSDGTVSIQ